MYALKVREAVRSELLAKGCCLRFLCGKYIVETVNLNLNFTQEA